MRRPYWVFVLGCFLAFLLLSANAECYCEDGLASCNELYDASEFSNCPHLKELYIESSLSPLCASDSASIFANTQDYYIVSMSSDLCSQDLSCLCKIEERITTCRESLKICQTETIPQTPVKIVSKESSVEKLPFSTYHLNGSEQLDERMLSTLSPVQPSSTVEFIQPPPPSTDSPEFPQITIRTPADSEIVTEVFKSSAETVRTTSEATTSEAATTQASPPPRTTFQPQMTSAGGPSTPSPPTTSSEVFDLESTSPPTEKPKHSSIWLFVLFIVLAIGLIIVLIGFTIVLTKKVRKMRDLDRLNRIRNFNRRWAARQEARMREQRLEEGGERSPQLFLDPRSVVSLDESPELARLPTAPPLPPFLREPLAHSTLTSDPFASFGNTSESFLVPRQPSNDVSMGTAVELSELTGQTQVSSLESLPGLAAVPLTALRSPTFSSTPTQDDPAEPRRSDRNRTVPQRIQIAWNRRQRYDYV